MDVAAKGLQAGLFVGLEQRRAGKADKEGVGQQLFHRLVQLACLGAVTLIDKDIEIPLGTEIFG